MKISTRSRYGLRLLMELAANDSGRPVFLSEIARNQEVSEKYLSKLVIPMRSAGFIRSVRGAHGGYILAVPPAQISLQNIVECLEGSLSLMDCTDNPDLCAKSEDCVSRLVWSGLEKVMRDYCQNLNLAEILALGERSNFGDFI